MLFFLFAASAFCKSDIFTLIFTVLFSSGKELKVINDLADAITHGRSGTGKTVPVGPGVFEEIRESAKYKSYMMGNVSIAANIIKQQVMQRYETNPSGTFEYKGSFPTNVCFQCDTLGNFCGKMNFVAEYKKDDCKTQVKATSYYFGVDPWDFVPNKGMSDSDNFWREKLPGKLVNLRGNFKVYNITYNISETYNFEF